LGGATEAAPGAAKTGSPLAAAPGASCRPGRGAAPYAGRFGDGSDGGGKAKPRKTPAGNKKKKAKEGLGPDAIKAMPKRARRILTLRNPELLEKAAECALRRPEAPADAAAPRKSAADDKKGPKKARLSRKNRRILNKYGLVANIYGERVSTKKLLSYRMLFTDPPIESMTDEEAAKNIRLLFLAFADHKFPEKYDKFVVFLRNNMCRGISEEQLERLLKILKGNSYITVKKDESVSVNIGLSAAAFAAKPHSSPKKK
jgi:hypothetical protein